MAIKHIITRGYGLGGTRYIPTRGYLAAAVPAVAGPYQIAGRAIYIPGGIRHAVFRAGGAASKVFVPGIVKGTVSR